jgi:solute carrier family 25 uncoupling protein 8/9
VNAGIQRQMAFAPIRIGLYEPVRNFYTQFSRKTPSMNVNAPTSNSISSSAPDGAVAQPPPPPSLLLKMAAGVTTSGVGITFASPTDVVKVRLQAEGNLPPGVPRRYNGVLDAYGKIIRTEGVAGLWTGYGPNLARNMLVSATELVMYDQTKQTLLAYNYPDTMTTHFMSALTAGFTATVLGSPVDVIKTNVMNAKADSPFKGPIGCATYLLKTQGPSAFYKGFVPNFARIGTWTIVAFTTLEQLKIAYYINTM